MAELVHVPAKIDKDALLDVIASLLEGVHDDDTLEGFLEFTVADVGLWDVRARFRIGNREGQGDLYRPPPAASSGYDH